MLIETKSQDWVVVGSELMFLGTPDRRVAQWVALRCSVVGTEGAVRDRVLPSSQLSTPVQHVFGIRLRASSSVMSYVSLVRLDVAVDVSLV
jgi:hypothetical protein